MVRSDSGQRNIAAFMSIGGRMDKRRLARSALTATMQVVISAALLFELYRFLSRQLTIEQIGIWSLVLASTAIGRLGDMGLSGGVVKFVANDFGRGAQGLAARTVGMAFISTAVLVGAVCFALHPLLWVALDGLIPVAEALSLARALLPYALGSLWLGALGNVVLSTLDGCLRTDMRSYVTISAGAFQLAAAYVVVPLYGLIGLGVTQLAQGVFTLLLATFLAARCLKQPLRAWLRFDLGRFVQVHRYGGAIQISALGQVLFEPAVKALLTYFGGLALTGYYEMGNRMVMQFRALIVSAYQTLIPYLASMERANHEVRRAYEQAYGLLFFIAMPYYALVAAGMPLLLTAWLGRFEPTFLLVAMLSWAGWMLNTLGTPAYFFYLGIGRLTWTVLGHMVIGLANVALASIGGWLYGGIGVLIGAIAALVIGSHVITVAFHKEFSVPLRHLVPRDSILLMAVSGGGSALVLWVAVTITQAAWWPAPAIISLGVAFVCVMGCMAWHPLRNTLLALVRDGVSAR